MIIEPAETAQIQRISRVLSIDERPGNPRYAARPVRRMVNPIVHRNLRKIERTDAVKARNIGRQVGSGSSAADDGYEFHRPNRNNASLPQC